MLERTATIPLSPSFADGSTQLIVIFQVVTQSDMRLVALNYL